MTANDHQANDTFVTNEFDVFFGRSPAAFRSPGNRRLMRRVAEDLSLYEHYNNMRSGSDKSYLITRLVNEVLSHGGRFLKQEKGQGLSAPSEGKWVQASKADARKKVGHLFRDQSRNGSTRRASSASKRSSPTPTPSPPPTSRTGVHVVSPSTERSVLEAIGARDTASPTLVPESRRLLTDGVEESITVDEPLLEPLSLDDLNETINPTVESIKSLLESFSNEPDQLQAV